MKNKPVIMNFSRIYEEETFYQDIEHDWLDCHEIQGVNGYCAEEAQEEIRRKIQDLPVDAVHFLDSGNYHYLSKFWLEKIEEPFALVVFDHHTDMQESAFFGMLSCGSWIKDVIETNPYVKQVCVIGPPKEAVKTCQQEGVRFVTEEELEQGVLSCQDLLDPKEPLPIYLSLDKDVLDPADARTNWDQGRMTLSHMETWIQELLKNRRLIGADICGENPQDTAWMPLEEELEINDQTNGKLLEILK